jgi:hypothetical protein
MEVHVTRLLLKQPYSFYHHWISKVVSYIPIVHMNFVYNSCFSHECHNDIIPLTLFNLTTLNTDSKSWDSSICNFIVSLLLHILQFKIFSLILIFSNMIIQCSLVISGQVSHRYTRRSKITDTNSSLKITNTQVCVITDLWSRRCTGPNVRASTRMAQYCSSISGDACATTFCSCTTSKLLRPAIASPCEKILSEYWNIGQKST